MIQSEITTWCQDKSKRTGAADLANMKKSLNRMLEWLSNAFILEQGKVFQCLKVNHQFSVVDGEYYKDLPVDFVSLTEDDLTLIDGSDETTMVKKDRTWFAENYYNQAHADATKEEPLYFYIEGDDIIFNKSNGAYTIQMPYTRLHPALVDDTTVIYFPNSYKLLLCFLTLSDYFEDLDNDEKASKFREKANEQLIMLGLINARNVGTPKGTAYNDL